MLNYLNDRTGLMADDTMALRVLEALQDVEHDEWASDDVWYSIDDTPTRDVDINAFGGLYASDDLLHISLYHRVLSPDGFMRVMDYDNPLGQATMTMDSMKELFGVRLNLD